MNSSTWYIAGINGTDQPKDIKLDLSTFSANSAKGLLITDGENRTFQSKTLDAANAEIVMIKNGGFVLVTQ